MEVLKFFSKNKSLSLASWTIHFFVAFFEVIGPDLLDAVNKSHLKCKVVGALNLSFIAMIPKRYWPKTFNDYRPISLHNLVYKIIAKITANRIKPVMSR